MRVPIYQVDAFTSRLFAGNPAAVCPLTRWLDDSVMQAVAAENNLSETGFFVPEGEVYRLRWFTPVREVDLCGHATLASGHVVLRLLHPERDRAVFLTRSGRLEVARDGGRLRMDLPAYRARPVTAPAGLASALGRDPNEVLAANYLMAVYSDEETVRALRPDTDAMLRAGIDEVIVTAPGADCDFVSRFFAPGYGIPEDPVTGSAHCALVPLWADRLGRRRLEARQLSPRGGELGCELEEDRVSLAGDAVLYLEGEIEIR